MKRLLVLLGVALVLASCGVKSDLTRPNGRPNPPDSQDPSKPPQPIGR
jgi:predicted small lipoprotein YifL